MTEKPEIAETGARAVPAIDPAAITAALGAAQKYVARAAQLDLTPTEKAELARFT